MGTLDILFGGGGGVVIGYSVFCVLFIAVLVLAVCSSFLVVPHIGRVLFLVLHAVVGGV